MKKLTDYILEARNKQIKEAVTKCTSTPEIGKTAYDSEHGPWTIEVVADMQSMTKEDYDKFISIYKFREDIEQDTSYEALQTDDADYIVGCQNEDDDREKAAWRWALDGVCYENSMEGIHESAEQFAWDDECDEDGIIVISLAEFTEGGHESNETEWELTKNDEDADYYNVTACLKKGNRINDRRIKKGYEVNFDLPKDIKTLDINQCLRDAVIDDIEYICKH